MHVRKQNRPHGTIVGILESMQLQPHFDQDDTCGHTMECLLMCHLMTAHRVHHVVDVMYVIELDANAAYSETFKFNE